MMQFLRYSKIQMIKITIDRGYMKHLIRLAFIGLCLGLTVFSATTLANIQIIHAGTFVLVKLHQTHLLWTVQIQLENNHRLMYAA